MTHAFADRLAEQVQRHGPLCVGIDPHWKLLPHEFLEREPAEALAAFAARILELVRPYCGIIKPQAAFFELFGPPGMQAMQDTLRLAQQMGYLTILDAKRGDIASTASAYAEAAFLGAPHATPRMPIWDADALTVNPYLGADAVEPFLEAARSAEPKRGIFVLVRTSNPGAGLFQDLACGNRKLYEHVAEAVHQWNSSLGSEIGYGDVGAVVGATHPTELIELRQQMPHTWFLIPGYGAQGGTAADVRAAYDSHGLGAIVNSSRGVTFPYAADDPAWEHKVSAAAQRAQAELRHRGA